MNYTERLDKLRLELISDIKIEAQRLAGIDLSDNYIMWLFDDEYVDSIELSHTDSDGTVYANFGDGELLIEDVILDYMLTDSLLQLYSTLQDVQID